MKNYQVLCFNNYYLPSIAKITITKSNRNSMSKIGGSESRICLRTLERNLNHHDHSLRSTPAKIAQIYAEAVIRERFLKYRNKIYRICRNKAHLLTPKQ